jgi:hypothetical protein
MKIILIWALIIMLSSCNSSLWEEQSEASWSLEIIETYVDTLEGSVWSAREAANTISNLQNRLQEDLEAIK